MKEPCGDFSYHQDNQEFVCGYLNPNLCAIEELQCLGPECIRSTGGPKQGLISSTNITAHANLFAYFSKLKYAITATNPITTEHDCQIYKANTRSSPNSYIKPRCIVPLQ